MSSLTKPLQISDDIIKPAQISWQTDTLGNEIPYSALFEDVYFSVTNGLAETRYVFLEQNRLTERFTQLFNPCQLFKINQSMPMSNTGQIGLKNDADRKFNKKFNKHESEYINCHAAFTIAELGFGTGLNVLATWQLWDTIKQRYSKPLPRSNSSDCSYDSDCSGNLLRRKNFTRPRLHIISTERHPLSLKDLQRSLAVWQVQDPALSLYIDRLLALYPTLVAGCHRLQLSNDVTLDLWLGDAAQSLAQLDRSESTVAPSVNAWYLDGFAPRQNQSLWTASIFAQMKRLSNPYATFATYSSAGVVKRGLIAAGFAIRKAKGFGDKRQMLTGYRLPALWTSTFSTVAAGVRDVTMAPTLFSTPFLFNFNNLCTVNNEATKDGLAAKDGKVYADNDVSKDSLVMKTSNNFTGNHIAIVGAGVAGLMAAWSLATRGMRVTLIDKTAPLAGASGNPRALLAPKMTPISHVAEHLHSISYLYGVRFYRQLDRKSKPFNHQFYTPYNPLYGSVLSRPQSQNTPASIFEPTGLVDLLVKTNINTDHIHQYPNNMATVLTPTQACNKTKMRRLWQDSLYLPQAGLINPKALTDKVLSHPNISFMTAAISAISTHKRQINNAAYVVLHTNQSAGYIKADDKSLKADAVVIAAAYHSHDIDNRIFDFRKIRGQISWFEPTMQQLNHLPCIPLKYNGYCAQFTPQSGDDKINPLTPNVPTFLLGASFIRNDTNTEVRQAEHHISKHKLLTALPELQYLFNKSSNIETQMESLNWQARAGIRAQTPDYHPLVGQVDDIGLIWTLSGMGSKGFAYAPICAEVLADKMTGQFAPLPAALLKRLDPKRKRLHAPLTN